MPPEETKHNSIANQTDLEAWIPIIIPALRTRWADQTRSLFPDQSTPKMREWLALLHTAAVNPQKIPRYLSQLLNAPKSSADLQRNWLILSKLFGITSEALQDKIDQLNPDAARNLLEIQNRITEMAASTSLVEEGQSTTDTYPRQARFLQTITDLNNITITTKNPNELLNEVVDLIQQNLGYDYINLFAFNQADQTLILKHAIWQNQHPDTEHLTSLEAGKHSITARAAATGRPILVNDIAGNADFSTHPFLPNLSAQLSVPLLAGNNLVGVLDIASNQTNAFSGDDRYILQALAAHIAAVIENARLQNLVQQRVNEQKLLHESNQALGTSLDLDTVLKLMTQKTAEVMEVGACTICKIDEKAEVITNLAEYISPHPRHPAHTWRTLNESIPISQDSIGQQVLKTGRAVTNWADAEKPANWERPTESRELKVSWGTVFALPLEVKGQMIGLMEVYDRDSHRSFSTDDIQLCQILATQTALAMKRAQQFGETRQRLHEVSTLYTVAQNITSSLDLQGTLDSIVISLRHVIGCRGCCIFLLDPTEQKLEIKAADGLKPQWKEMAKLNIGEGAAGTAVARRQTICIPDTHKEPDFIFFDQEVRSLIVIPLTSQGEIIGTINLDDNKPNAFGPEQEQLLSIAAAQAGIAIENARLFAKVATEQQQTQTIIQYMADGLLLIDDHGTIVKCNPALSMMLGIPSGEIVGQKIDSPDLHPNLVSITGTTTQRARTGVLAKELTIETPQSKTLQVFSTIMVGDNGKPSAEVRVVHDVTRERELEQLKEDFMSTISHELRTPLFSIQGFVQILLESEEELDPATREEFLTIIQTQAVQLSEMVNNLLDASKFDEGKLKFEQQPVAMLDVINQTLLKLRGFAHQQKVELVPELSTTLPTIIGDKERLEQVLTNLIGNAIKFTPEQGKVTIATSAPDNEILVEVADTGIGIPPELQDKIFSRYYQVEDMTGEGDKHGSGLGLYIAKQIIKGHSGRIWVESNGIPGQGSTFRFSLPRPDTPVENQA